MANIKKIELNLSQKLANPFKTARKSDTNPFKYSNFEGNTLQFADVFEGFEPKQINKLKMITSSVMGSLTKVRNGITEPIVHFVNKVREGLHTTSENIHSILSYDVGKGITDSITGIKQSISNKVTSWKEGVTGIGKDLSETWTNLISRVQTHKITSDIPVAELRQMWINENEIAEKATKTIKEAA